MKFLRRKQFLSFASMAILAANVQASTTGLVPLNSLGDQSYEGFTGGLYAGGKHVPHGAHAEALRKMCVNIEPVDEDGNPDAGGKIVVIGVGASVCKQVFDALEQMAPEAEGKRAEVVFVNGARGGHDVNKISDPTRRYWEFVRTTVEEAGFSPAQVQVAWYQSDDLGDTKDDFPGRPQRLQEAIARNMHELRQHFPNTRLCYHSARHTTAFMPADKGKSKHSEPRPWHVGWAVKWLIEAQTAGSPELRFDGDTANAPLISWATYFWTDGDQPRADGYHWTPDMNVKDGVHLTDAGKERVANELLTFWRTDAFARLWFTGVKDINAGQPALIINGKSKFAKLERLLGTTAAVKLVAFDMSGKKVLAVADVFQQHIDLNARLGSGEFRLHFLGPDGQRLKMSMDVPEVVRLK